MQPETDLDLLKECIECIESKICLILTDTGFGKLEIFIERPKKGKGTIAIIVQSGVSKRFVYREIDIQSCLKYGSSE
ncbi:MAG: hypothetical protein RMY34_09000 [Aulosira sp. DedQUE10]|nr:hypothetical protein [Aulosira sp. DedQUE10]